MRAGRVSPSRSPQRGSHVTSLACFCSRAWNVVRSFGHAGRCSDQGRQSQYGYGAASRDARGPQASSSPSSQDGHAIADRGSVWFVSRNRHLALDRPRFLGRGLTAASRGEQQLPISYLFPRRRWSLHAYEGAIADTWPARRCDRRWATRRRAASANERAGYE